MYCVCETFSLGQGNVSQTNYKFIWRKSIQFELTYTLNRLPNEHANYGIGVVAAIGPWLSLRLSHLASPSLHDKWNALSWIALHSSTSTSIAIYLGELWRKSFLSHKTAIVIFPALNKWIYCCLNGDALPTPPTKRKLEILNEAEHQHFSNAINNFSKWKMLKFNCNEFVRILRTTIVVEIYAVNFCARPWKWSAQLVIHI